MKLAFQGTIDYGGQGTFLIELTKHLADKIENIHIFPNSISANDQQILDIYGNIPQNVEIHKSSNLLKNFIKEVNSFKKFGSVLIYTA